MALIYTTKGDVEESTLERSVVFKDLPTEFVIEVEWRLDGELVKRNAHVILKQVTVTASAIAGGF